MGKIKFTSVWSLTGVILMAASFLFLFLGESLAGIGLFGAACYCAYKAR